MTQPTSSRSTPLTLLGGGLGIASCFIGLAIFLTACAGFSAVFMFSIISGALAVVGLVLSVVGPNVQKHLHVEDSQVFAAIFLNLLGIVGSLLIMSAWFGWKLFA